MERSIKLFVGVLVAYSLAALSAGQGPPEGDPPPPNPPKVLFDGAGTAVKVLNYSAEYNSQLATFNLSLANTDLEGIGLHGPESYSWQPTTPEVGKLQIVTYPGAATAIGIAKTPGVYDAVCIVNYRNSNNAIVPVTFTSNCAVIGGPISISTTVDQWGRKSFSHDENDPALPWFIGYCGYSHWFPPPLLGVKIQYTQDAFRVRSDTASWYGAFIDGSRAS